jgi:hypothetical protein
MHKIILLQSSDGIGEYIADNIQADVSYVSTRLPSKIPDLCCPREVV